eukprot:scaffold2114_cov253-Pinguiococcus_pyrenoidosus.AAC.27
MRKAGAGQRAKKRLRKSGQKEHGARDAARPSGKDASPVIIEDLVDSENEQGALPEVLCAADLNLSGTSKELSRKRERRLMKARKKHTMNKGKPCTKKLELGGNKYKASEAIPKDDSMSTTPTGNEPRRNERRRSTSSLGNGVKSLWSAEQGNVWKKQKELKERQKKEREMLSIRQSVCESAACDAASRAKRVLCGKQYRTWKEAVCSAAQELEEERVTSDATERLRHELRHSPQTEIEAEVAKVREMIGALPSLAMERRRLSSMAENRKAGDKAFAAQEYFSALRFWMQAMYDSAATSARKDRGYWHVQLHCNRAAAHLKLQDARRAYDEATVALSIDETYAKARWRRAAALSLMGGRENLEEAKADLDIAAQLLSRDLSKNASRKLLQEVQTGLAGIEEELKNPEPRGQEAAKEEERSTKKGAAAPDAAPTRGAYLEVLQLPSTATPDQVRKAFKRMALKWHPDKWSGRSSADKEEAAESFRKISDAKDALLAMMKDDGPFIAGADRKRSSSRPTPDPVSTSGRGRTPGSAGYFSNWSNPTPDASRQKAARRHRTPGSAGFFSNWSSGSDCKS